MDMLDKRMNDKGKNWRHVLKSLKVLDYCLHEGSELVVTWARKNVYLIKTLREFQYVDDDGKDVGQNGVFTYKSFFYRKLTKDSTSLGQRAYLTCTRRRTFTNGKIGSKDLEIKSYWYRGVWSSRIWLHRRQRPSDTAPPET